MDRFFDRMEEGLRSASKEVIEKSKELGSEAKIRTTIMSEERKIKEQYRIIGEVYYKLHKEDAEDAFKVMINKIRQSEKVICQAKKDLTKIRPEKEVVKAEPCEGEAGDDGVIDYQFVDGNKEATDTPVTEAKAEETTESKEN